MKSFAVVLALLVATSNAFSPLLATRAVGKPAPAKKPVATVAVKKAAPKPVVKKAAPVVAKKAAPVAKAAPAKAAPKPKPVVKVSLKAPAFSLPSLKAKPKPKINIQGPKTTRVAKKVAFAYDDGLTELERKQRKSLPIFLTGSAKSQVDPTSVRPELVKGTDEYFFSPYDTTLATVGALVIISLIIKAGSP